MTEQAVQSAYAFGRFHPRRVLALPVGEADGWRLKRYALLADGRGFAPQIADAAFDATIARLPEAEAVENNTTYGNHGIGIQIVHFAESAVVAPVFYWVWQSVLARLPPLRAPWSAPTEFGTGAEAAVGRVWELQIVAHEAQSWTDTMLSGRPASPMARRYLEDLFPSARAPVGAS